MSTIIHLWPFLFYIPVGLFFWYLLRVRNRALRIMFDEIRKTKRIYVLNEKGTAYIEKDKK